MMTFESFARVAKPDSISTSVASDILGLLKRFKDKSKIEITLQYRSLSNAMVHLLVNRTSSPPEIGDREKIVFDRNGFVLDSEAYVPATETPGINLTIWINPAAESYCLENLEYSIIDAVRHEIEHTRFEKQPDHAERRSSMSSYRYFLLDDEIPSMIAGLGLAAKREGVSLVTAMSNYLTPFVESGFMTVQEFDEVMQTWLEYANSN